MATCSKGCITLWVKLLTVSHHYATFGGHRPCSSRDMTDLIFHVDLGLCEFMEEAPHCIYPPCQVW